MWIDLLTESIGNTPLVRLRSIGREIPQSRSGKVAVFAKLEYFNPGGSVKDRPALRMIQEAVAAGQLTKDKVILDSTSGNTGIAYAWIGAALGYKIEIVMPENVSQQRKEIVKACGAKTIFSSPMEGSDGAIRLCQKILAEGKGRFIDQIINGVWYGRRERPLLHAGSVQQRE